MVAPVLVSKVSKQMTKGGHGAFHRIQSWSTEFNGYSSDILRMMCSMNSLKSKATFRDRYTRGMTG